MANKDNPSTKISFFGESEFVEKLWSKIVDDRLFSYQKNDICDYLLYLFNKYDKGKFLDMNSNAENERLLTMTDKENAFCHF